MEKSENYHDYVIKDGKFVGEFEQMYRDCEDPWTQSTQPNKYSRMACFLHIKQFKIKSVLECGSGLGYYSDWLRKETGVNSKGLDVSETSVKRAKELFPDLDFEQADISKDLHKYTDHEAVLFSEIMWYILDDLDVIIADLKKHFSGKYLLINQVFYKGSQRYGTEYFTNVEELKKYFQFEVLAECSATRSEDSTIETSVLFRIP